ncbi:MAG: class I SAM-dependent methyltransferase [Pseudomonadota bacterium]
MALDPASVADWNRRHAASAGTAASPCAALTGFAEALPQAGTALDVACGGGGNALWLARRGLQVVAVDQSEVAIDRVRRAAGDLPITGCVAVLADAACLATPFDLIVVSRFLDRGLCGAITAALAPGGTLVYQTFVGPHRGHGPRRPAFRLREGELPSLFPTLHCVHYDEGDTEPGQAVLIARAPGRG